MKTFIAGKRRGITRRGPLSVFDSLQLLTVPEVSRLCDRSERTVRRHFYAGRLKAHRLDRYVYPIYFLRSEVERWKKTLTR